MDFHVGIGGKGFSMLCGDTAAVQQIITIKNDEQKLVPIDSHKLFALAGEAGDRVQFTELIIANVKLYSLRNGQHLSTHAVANFTREQIAKAARKVRYFPNAAAASHTCLAQPCHCIGQPIQVACSSSIPQHAPPVSQGCFIALIHHVPIRSAGT
jgi:hypothetical protein